MLISSILDAVIHRAGKQFIADYGEPFILESLNRIYKEASEEYRALEKEYTFNFADVTDVEATPYMDLPADWLYPRKIAPFRIFRDAQIFNNEEPDTYTFALRRFYVAMVAADSSFDTIYYSLGRTLVNQTPVVYDAQEDAYKLLNINEPEWTPEHLHGFLIYSLALELSPQYPLMQMDMVKLAKLTEQLDRRRHLSTLANPIMIGEEARRNDYSTEIDSYA